jgi:hypothetical protein
LAGRSFTCPVSPENLVEAFDHRMASKISGRIFMKEDWLEKREKKLYQEGT